MDVALSLLQALRRVTSWQLHKIGDILDPQASYYQPVRDLDDDDEKWILSLVQNYQPIPWAQLIVWSALPISKTREITQDLIEAELITATINGFVMVSSEGG